MNAIFTSIDPTPIGEVCRLSIERFGGSNVTRIDQGGELPDGFKNIAGDPRISKKTKEDVARLFAVCLRGGISISPDLLLIEPLSLLGDLTSFCASTKTSVPLSCIFGVTAESALSVALMTCLEEAVAEGVEVIVKLQNAVGLVQSLLMHPSVTPLVTFLPYQKFAVFGVQSNAAAFAFADEGERRKMLNQISGRMRGETPVGVFVGRQDHIRPPSITGVVRKNTINLEVISDTVALPAPTLPPPTQADASLGKMASGIIKAATKAVKSLAAGEVFGSSDEEIKSRSMKCMGDEGEGIPPCGSYNSDQGRCRECGCYLKLKIRIKSSQCPLGKW